MFCRCSHGQEKTARSMFGLMLSKKIGKTRNKHTEHDPSATQITNHAYNLTKQTGTNNAKKTPPNDKKWNARQW